MRWRKVARRLARTFADQVHACRLAFGFVPHAPTLMDPRECWSRWTTLQHEQAVLASSVRGGMAEIVQWAMDDSAPVWSAVWPTLTTSDAYAALRNDELPTCLRQCVWASRLLKTTLELAAEPSRAAPHEVEEGELVEDIDVHDASAQAPHDETPSPATPSSFTAAEEPQDVATLLRTALGHLDTLATQLQSLSYDPDHAPLY